MANPMVETERMEVVKVREKLPQTFLKAKEFREETFICVKREMIRDVIALLKDDPDLQYDYFSECVGVVYNLMSLKHSSRIFVKVGVNDGQKVPTLKYIFLGAEYPEKEIADLYGVI